MEDMNKTQASDKLPAVDYVISCGGVNEGSFWLGGGHLILRGGQLALLVIF